MEIAPAVEALKAFNLKDILVIVGSFIGITFWIQKRMDRTIDRMDARIKEEHQAIQKQSERSDQLYQEFILLIKEMKKTPSKRS